MAPNTIDKITIIDGLVLLDEYLVKKIIIKKILNIQVTLIGCDMMGKRVKFTIIKDITNKDKLFNFFFL